jgi:hypothetical protein
MAYGLRYTLTEKMRDGNSAIVKIYEDSYTGDFTTYKLTNIDIVPNSNDEDPLGGIISSQLNVSFLLSNNDDLTNFPDLINSNDRKYYVELVYTAGISGELLKWRGYIFNDYIEIPFSTGNLEARFVCVDALSYLKYTTYSSLSGNTNQLTSLLDVVNICLNNIAYPTATYFYSCISYFANGMFDRGVANTNEPLTQTYQYRRDFVGLDYYTILDNIVKSFGSRLFQYEGIWYILPISELAGTNLYCTKYQVGSSPTLIGYVSLFTPIVIYPYAPGQVHFINNSQTKIIRKGYSRLTVNTDFDFVDNYINNGDFKQYTTTTTAPTGFTLTTTGAGFLQLYNIDDDIYNDVRIQAGTGSGGGGTVQFEMTGSAGSVGFLPYMINQPGTVSFEYDLYYAGPLPGFGNPARCKMFINVFVGGTTYYLKDDNTWTTAVSYIEIPEANTAGIASSPRNSYTRTIPFGIAAAGTATYMFGYAKVGFLLDLNYSYFRFRNFRLQQGSNTFKSVKIKRTLGSNLALEKVIDIPYGSIYPDTSQPNTIGTLYNSSAVKLTEWYRYGKAGVFSSLNRLICRVYSNIFNKNMATLEGDFGELKSPDGVGVYLQAKYAISDSSPGNLSYSDKIFMANRLTVIPSINQVTSVQLLEISNTDNASFESIKYE